MRRLPPRGTPRKRFTGSSGLTPARTMLTPSSPAYLSNPADAEVDSTDSEELHRRLKALADENARLKAPVADLKSALAESEERYRTLFNSIDEGFCIIEFFDGPHGPLSDYVHIEANPAYSQHAGIPDVVGQKLREMVPDEADGWVELYGGVLRTGIPIRFERELVATGRHLELAAFRIEPASRRQVAVLFQDITPPQARRKGTAEPERDAGSAHRRRAR
jgi:PAS domain-containing protein